MTHDAGDAMPTPAGDDPGAVAVDVVTALGTTLSRPDGRVGTVADRAAQGPLLVVVVEHRCPVCRHALEALHDSGARLVVISQGRTEAAGHLVAATGLDESDVLVEPDPHPVSDALAARGVPTFALVEGLELVAWQDGWDLGIVADLVRRAGGALARPERWERHAEPCASRLTHDASARVRLENDDAGLVTYAP